MNERGKSDSPVVPAKLPNKAARVGVAEVVVVVVEEEEELEEGGLAKGNTSNPTRPGHRAGSGVSSGLDRVREAARRIGMHGSRRCCITSMSTVSGRPTGRSARRSPRGWTG
jgi:hypothetical protein